MLFIETEIFTEDVQKLLTDDEFSRFQFFLALNPDYGEVIPETGGLRKVRWVSGGKGKRAGVNRSKSALSIYHLVFNNRSIAFSWGDRSSLIPLR